MLDFLRSNIRAMSGYTPGEQLADGFIKLNTNENPYPPSPRVIESIQAALASDRLRKYPDPAGTSFRKAAGRHLGVDPDAILIGNGSDDVLTIITRAFVPENGLVVSPTPSYLLYQTLAEIQGARYQTVPYTDDWQLSLPWPIPRANLTFIANPNSPSGTTLPLKDLEQLADELSGALLLDEAYVDFADAHGLSLIRRGNVIVTRSFSKSYSLAGIRFGFAVADPAVVRELIKVKDSYNCDVLSMVAATAAIEDQEYFQTTRAQIIATRSRLTKALQDLGFDVCPSQANFVWCRIRNVRKDQESRAKGIYQELKRRKILVRYMVYPNYGDGLRISIGSDAEIEQLLQELKQMI
jgi:histidinol-phosphate aminotransferase